MGDNSSGSRQAQGPANSPLRIFTKLGHTQSDSGNGALQDDRSPHTRDTTNILLNNAFLQPYDDDGNGDSAAQSRAGRHGAAAPNTTGHRSGKQAQRVGRQAAQYHALPSHWRDHESGSSSTASPVTPEGAEGGVQAYTTIRDANAARVAAKQAAGGRGQNSPGVSSPRVQQVGALREAFGSASSLEWGGERPGSSYSMLSAEAQAESPLETAQGAAGSRFPPALSSMAARTTMRNALGVHGAGRHRPTASMSSQYSMGMQSPTVRAGSASSQPPTTAVSPATDSAPQNEDIVRKYFGLQRRAPSAASTPPLPPPAQAAVVAPAAAAPAAGASTDVRTKPSQKRQKQVPGQGVGSGIGSGDDSGSMVYRRAVSSGDLPTMDTVKGGAKLFAAGEDGREFLTPDLVESPLEALVRHLTIELFQLYVNEDRKKTADSAAQSKARDQDKDDSPESLGASIQTALSLGGGEPEYVQQFRLGPSLRSGSTTPAVTMDGYFVPQKPDSENKESADTQQPRPRHRLVQRTWMEEALIKARRVSTIDENAEESILQSLDQELAKGKSPPFAPADVSQFQQQSQQSQQSAATMLPRTAQKDQLSDMCAGGSPSDGQTHVMSPRGYYRARDPAAPHRKNVGERGGLRGKPGVAGISPARASLLRAVGRRQSVRLQPGKGQIMVAETHMDNTANAQASADVDSSALSAPLSMEPDAISRAKRANSLPGLMQVPETREISYKDTQRRAARRVVLKRSSRSRARVVRRAERVVLGGTQQPGSHHHHHQSGGRKRHGHRRAPSRADIDQQLLKVELPPPVPLRVRREQIKFAPETLIVVRRPSKYGQLRIPADVTSEQKMLRVHNQLLGAQAMLSRHNSIMRQAAAAGAGGSAHDKSIAGGLRTVTQQALGSGTMSQAKNKVRSEALDGMMLDNALDESLEDDDWRNRPSNSHQRHGDGTATPDGSDDPTQNKPWRNARRRSTLRKKGRDSPAQQQTSSAREPKAPAASDAPVSRSAAQRGRRLLLHGPAFRIYSGIRARPDTYLFLFNDVLVVTTQLSGSQQTSSFTAAPSADPATVPAGSRFKVHIVIPLSRSATSLKTMREGASKRPGEDDDAEERRLERQEERIRRACHLFEKNTSEAVVYLINRDIIEPVPDMVAGFLYRCTALSRRQLGSFLGAGILGENLHENPTADEVEQEKLFHRQIWVSFLDRCNIVGVPIDEALRSVLFNVRLPNSQASISVLLEIAALQWFAKNAEHGAAVGVFVPDSQDMAIKLAFAIMTLNTELHNPLLRAEAQPDAAFRELVLKFRASVVDDPVFSGKRKGNVLRKRDQPRVLQIMEVPTMFLKEIYQRVRANRLVTCSDARPAAPELDVDWIRDPADPDAAPLSDDQIEREVEDVYCDPGFRDSVLFNASSDRLPAKLNVDPPAWLRVTIRIPDPDPKLTIRVRVLSVPADAQQGGPGGDVAGIVPADRLSFRSTNSASFVIRPLRAGHFTLHFISEGAHARYYHPIPSRSMVVEGSFMRQTVQLSWKRAEEQGTSSSGGGHRARYMFGMDSYVSKAQWVHFLEAALKESASVPPDNMLRSAESASQALAALVSDQQKSLSASGAGDNKLEAAGGAATARSKTSAAADQTITSAQLFGALGCGV
ncbi:hypothetical protein EV178_001836 [Coemansia sp. RSA 1646]|nr:hypothetical protein EV178_001836 [Coemansia sp. RSA 1646]KAJ2093013.1 hypothetical protein IW138_000727 [Coemansia sp. RSA 986]